MKKFIDAIETISCVALAMLELLAFKIVLEAVWPNYQMIFGKVQLTDEFIKDVAKSYILAGPTMLAGWAQWLLTKRWCRTKRTEMEERS